MPESLEVLPQKICENLSDLCPECLNAGRFVCNGHEVLVAAAAAAASAPTSGGSCRSVRGSKRPFSLESSDSRRCGNMEHAAKVSKCLAASTGGARDESPASSNAQPLSDIPRIHRELGQAPEVLEVNGLPVGGVRFRNNLNKFVVEHRPSKFKWKLWMGTYLDLEQGKRAIDAARFYTGQENGPFWFADSPAIFREQGPLLRPFASISKEVKDKQFAQDVKRRAKAAVRKDIQAHKLAAKQITVQQEAVISSSVVEDVERGLLCPVVPSIGFDSIPPILTPSTATSNTGSLGNFPNLEDWDEEFELEEHLGIPLEEENQESDVVQDDDVTVDVSVSSMNLVAAAEDYQVIDQWLYPEFMCCASSEVQKFSALIPSFELDFDNGEFGAHEADHNLRSSLDYMPSGDDGDDNDMQLWDYNNN
ncbi:unnamed protein product [Sphagnum compactum]